MLLHIKDRHLKILEYLSIYKFLTIKQFDKLGVLKGSANISRALAEIKKGKQALVGQISFGLQIGKIPFVFYLTKYGVDFLLENSDIEFENINFPKGTATFFYNDYFHRIACVDFQIGFRKWIESKDIEIEFYYNYYDKIGSNRKTNSRSIVKTKIEINSTDFYIPDSVFKFGSGRKKLVYLFEQSNGKNTKKIFNQIDKHALGIARQTPMRKYKTGTDCRVILVFEYDSTKQAVMKRIADDPVYDSFKYHFLFKTENEVELDFNECWHIFDGSMVDFLGKKG